MIYTQLHRDYDFRVSCIWYVDNSSIADIDTIKHTCTALSESQIDLPSNIHVQPCLSLKSIYHQTYMPSIA